MTLCERTDKEIEKLQAFRQFAALFDDSWECYEPYRILNYIVGLNIENVGQLHEVRFKLRKLFGKWEDELSIHATGDIACARWSSKTESVAIIMWCHVHDFPASLMKPGCRFVRQTQTKASAAYRYVCESKEAGHE